MIYLQSKQAQYIQQFCLCSVAAVCSGLMPTFTGIKDLIVNGVKLKLSRNPTVLPPVDREGNQALRLA